MISWQSAGLDLRLYLQTDSIIFILPTLSHSLRPTNSSQREEEAEHPGSIFYDRFKEYFMTGVCACRGGGPLQSGPGWRSRWAWPVEHMVVSEKLCWFFLRFLTASCSQVVLIKLFSFSFRYDLNLFNNGVLFLNSYGYFIGPLRRTNEERVVFIVFPNNFCYCIKVDSIYFCIILVSIIQVPVLRTNIVYTYCT